MIDRFEKRAGRRSRKSGQEESTGQAHGVKDGEEEAGTAGGSQIGNFFWKEGFQDTSS